MPADPIDKKDHIALLERRLKRERTARLEAESLLTEKSMSAFSLLHESQVAQKELELALWASQESFWRWEVKSDLVTIRSFSLDSQHISIWSGTLIHLMSRVHEDDIESLQFHWTMALHGNREKIEFSFRMMREGKYQWVRLRGRVLKRGKAGEAHQIVGTTKDITQQRQAEQSFHLMASAFASSREPMLVLSPDLVITECNNAYLQLVGLRHKEQCIGKQFSDIFVESKVNAERLATEKQMRFESQVTNEFGEVKSLDVSLALFETHQQNASYLIATMRDISDRKRNEAKLRQLALRDELTGLSNRNALRETIGELVAAKQVFTIVFVDLDGFKAINDSAGHERGDEELQRVANVLNAIFSSSGDVGRWGGDEFIAVVPKQTTNLVALKAQQLIKQIEQDKVATRGIELTLSASIGIAEFPAHGANIESLIQCADAAMYRAKELGKGQTFIYEIGLYENMTQQVSMVSDLRRAVENHLLDFYIQGKYDLNGELKGGEVLCRWTSGLHGVVSPVVFIPLAEEHKLDSEIGLQALEAACDYISIMESQHGSAIPLSVNISANQMLAPHFPDDAVSICVNNKVSPEYIELELTESVFIQNEKAALRSLNMLRKKGFRLSLDDFGSGFSSLSYLRSFEFQVVKVDKSLIQGIHQDSKANALFVGLIAMLKSLQIEVVVEGVEFESYLPFIEMADVQLMQGFFFDKPMPYDQFLARHTSTLNR